MDIRNIPSDPRTAAEYNECFCAFSKAVTEKNEDFINVLISKKGILNKHFTENKDTLLHIVAQRGTVATASKMCNLGLDVNSRNNFNETPIFYAIKNSPEMVNLLINNGASLNVSSKEYTSPLQEALLSGTEKIVQIIINQMFSNKFQYRLRCIRVQNSEETIKVLLNHRKDLYLRDDNYYPLLIFFAARIGNLDLFKLALNSCRKYLNSIKDKKSMQMLARFLPPKELNFDGFVDSTALHYALSQQVPEVVDFLLKEGADVNCKTIHGYTPLHFAAYFEDEESCKILLSSGAQQMNHRNGVSPLHLVCGSNKSPKLSWHGSNCFYQKSDGFVRNRILHQSSYNFKPTFHEGIMILLLQHGADPDFVDTNDGMTPLLRACKAGRLEPIKLLLEFGANIQTCDRDGNSALHLAVLYDNFKIVDFLLQRGLDIERKDKEGNTPLVSKIHMGGNNCMEMIEYLADFGANVNAIDGKGGAALHIATDWNRPDYIESLLELGADFKVECTVSYYISYLNDSSKTMAAFVALKEDMLGDYIENYIKNERDEISQIHQYFDKCKLEIKQLKCTHILANGRFSFYDFLSRDIYSALQMIENRKIREVFTSEKYRQQFPCYRYLLEKRFKRLELLEKTINDVVVFLLDFKNLNLPILIVEKILNFLGSSDFRNFGRALHMKEV